MSAGGSAWEKAAGKDAAAEAIAVEALVRSLASRPPVLGGSGGGPGDGWSSWTMIKLGFSVMTASGALRDGSDDRSVFRCGKEQRSWQAVSRTGALRRAGS